MNGSPYTANTDATRGKMKSGQADWPWPSAVMIARQLAQRLAALAEAVW